MSYIIVALLFAAAGFITGFLVCRKNYAWVQNVEQAAIDKAKAAAELINNATKKL